ncbi:MAG: TlpA family protein disulfide reductase [Bacteroidetes bacterium]|nr:TlpA family protein disulfide reductase [Bacteroidota bacterium]
MRWIPILLVGSSLFAQTISIAKLPDVKRIYERANDTTYVINFWATWCSPCIEELPYFEEANQFFSTEKVRIVLVSVDFRSQFESKVKPFVIKRKMKTDVVLLDEADANNYIDAIDPSWSGAIPATLVVNNYRDLRIFKGEAFTKEELFRLIRSTIN